MLIPVAFDTSGIRPNGIFLRFLQPQMLAGVISIARAKAFTPPAARIALSTSVSMGLLSPKLIMAAS